MKSSLDDEFAKFVSQNNQPNQDSGEIKAGTSDLDNEFSNFIQKQYESQPAPTIGEDISNLWQGAQNLGGQAWDTAKMVGNDIMENPAQAAQSAWSGAQQLPQAIGSGLQKAGGIGVDIASHPLQTIAGAAPAIGSIADIMVPVVNAGMSIPEYAYEKYTGKTIPEAMKAKRFEHKGEELGNKLSDLIVGKPETEEEKTARTAGSIGSAFINPTKGIKELATKTLAKAKNLPGKVVGFAPEKYAAFEKAGLGATVPEVSKYKSLEKVRNAVGNVPFAGGRIEKAAKTREEHINKVLGKLGNIHEAKPLRRTGELTEEGAKAYNKKATDIAEKLYDKPWKSIDKKAPVPMADTYRAIQESLEAISPAARARLANSSTGKELLKLEEDIITSGGAIPFGDLKSVYKRDIDQGVKMWEGVADLDQATLKKISGAMKSDMDKYITQVNPTAAKDLAKADKYWSKYSERNREIANKAIKETDPTKVFNNMMSDLKGGDITPPKVILQRMNPANKKEFSEIALSELGRGANGEFDLMHMAKEAKKMRPESLDILLSGYPKEQATQIKDIIEATSLMKPNAQQNAGVTYTMALLGGLGLPKISLAGIPASIGMAEMLSNPKVTKFMNEASKAKTAYDLGKIIDKYPNILGKIGAQASPALGGVLKQKDDEAERERYRNIPTIDINKAVNVR